MLRKLVWVGIGFMLASHPAVATPFADSVISYDPGSGAAAAFRDPTTALGAPARTTGGPSDVTVFNSPFGIDQIVSIGSGGHLTVFFDEPVLDDALNPFGIDLLIFGNTFFAVGSGGIVIGSSAEPASIFLSQDGLSFFEVSGVFADDLFPTQGFLDTTDPFGGFGGGGDGSDPTNFTLPVDPSLGIDDFLGLTYPEILALYDGSGGGTGVDLAAVGLDWVQYVRIEGLLSSAEIDAFADVAPIPEPATGALAALGLVALAIRARRSRA